MGVQRYALISNLQILVCKKIHFLQKSGFKLSLLLSLIQFGRILSIEACQTKIGSSSRMKHSDMRKKGQ